MRLLGDLHLRARLRVALRGLLQLRLRLRELPLLRRHHLRDGVVDVHGAHPLAQRRGRRVVPLKHLAP